MSTLAFVPPASAPPGLAPALDRRSVLRLVSERLAPPCEVLALTPVYLRFKGEDGALVGWQVQLDDAGCPRTFVTVRVGPAWRLADEAEQHAERTYEPLGGLLPCALALDGQVLLLAFPADRALRELRHWTRVKYVRRLLASELGLPRGGGEGLVKSGARLEVVRYKPERRAVLRWDLARGEPSGPRLRCFLRVHAEPRAAAAAAAEQAAGAAGVRCPRTLAVPHPYLAIEAELEGRPIERLSAAQAEEAGALLARLHGARADGVPRVAGPVEELDAVLRASLALSELDPELGERIHAIADRLAERLPVPAAAVLLHGDFHAGQLLAHAGELGVVDFDRACAGYAAYDLASFRAALEVRGLPGAEDLAGALTRGYAALRPLPAPRELAWFEACALARASLTPFRMLAPDWTARARALLALAAQRLCEP